MMKKRDKLASVHTPVVDIFRREVGHLSTRKFAHHFATSEDRVMRLHLAKTLVTDVGCVGNTVSFNTHGDILVSVLDDWRVILWDWETSCDKLSFKSGHNYPIFEAKIIPETDDRSIVTCAADGQVRHATILECGKVATKLLARHQGKANKLANEPATPHVFYSCGEDGLVQHFDLRTGEATQLFTCQPVRRRIMTPVVYLNAIAIDPLNPNLFVTAGADEFTRLYDIRRYRNNASAAVDKPVDYFCPEHLLGDENVGITGLAFSDQSELLVSYTEDLIYLFSKNMGWGTDINSVIDYHHVPVDSSTSEMETDAKPGPQVFKGHRNCLTIKGVSFFGANEYVVSGSDCGRVFIWGKKDAKLVRVMEADVHVVNYIEPHPHTLMLASCGTDYDIKIWTPTALEKAPPPTSINKLDLSNPHRITSHRDTLRELLALQMARMRRGIEPDENNEEGDRMDWVITFSPDNSDNEEQGISG